MKNQAPKHKKRRKKPKAPTQRKNRKMLSGKSGDMLIPACSSRRVLGIGKSKVGVAISKKQHKINNLAFFSLFLYLVITGLFTLFPTSTYAQNRDSPVVVELFTSKYCPACPAADRNFNSLIVQHPNVIGLSCHVTYFNKGTRTDALSRSFCDARQLNYKRVLKTGGIFTPMTIIQGKSYKTGTKHTELKTLIQRSQARTYQSVGLSLNKQYLDIQLPTIPLGRYTDIWLIEVEKQPTQNRYRHYRNAVIDITKLMRWDGRAMNMAFPVERTDQNTGYALIVQDRNGAVVTAAKTGF